MTGRIEHAYPSVDVQKRRRAHARDTYLAAVKDTPLWENA